MAIQRVLSRTEAKSITRRRILDAAGSLIAETGYAGLSASAVARAAGIAQPTFYVHFRDKDDLLRTLGDELIGSLRGRLREARERVLAGQGVEALRETFRIPLDVWIEHPALLRLHAQELHQTASPIGAMLRTLRGEVLRDLADDLARFGLPSATPAERERLEMMADAMIAQTEALALSFVDGRYRDREAVIDVLTQSALGMLGTFATSPS